MTAARRAVLALVGVAVVLGGAARAAAAQEDRDADPERVLVISAPHLTWSILQEEAPPRLLELLEQSSVAAMSVRTIGRRTDIGAGYLTLGAGNRTASDPGPDGLVLERTETLTTGDPASLFARATGIVPTAPILALGIPQVIRTNDAQEYGTAPGALGTALEEAERSVAVVGNADETADAPTERHAGLFAMDRDGQVAGGAVGRQLLEIDPASAYGVRLGSDAVLEAFDAAWDAHDVVLLEMSDLRRAETARSTATPEQADRLFRRALLHDDGIVGEVLDRIAASGRPTRVFLVAPVSPREVEQTTVFATAGPGVDPTGMARSSTTRRDGYVTLTDVAPTILGVWGIEVPEEMGDTPISTPPGEDTLATRVDGLVDANDRAIVRDQSFGRLTVILIVVLVVDLVLAVLYLAWAPRLGSLVQFLALVVLAVPPLSFLLGLLPMGSMSTFTVGLALFGGAAVVAALARWAWGRGAPGAAWYLVLALWAVLAADVATGGHLQINTVFGYSPIVAGRFAGFGNQAFSMFAIAALLLATATSAPFTRQGVVQRGYLAAAAAFLGLSVVLDGHPALGSDVGGVLALAPASAVALLLLARVRIRPRVIGAVALGTLVVIGAFALVDLGRPEDQRTHLGRFVTAVGDGEALQILERKVSANISVLDSVWSWIIPVALAFFVYLTWRPSQTLEQLQRRHPWFRTFGISGLVLGVLAMVVNDSGVSMPAMMLAISLAYTTYLVVDLDVRAPPPAGAGDEGRAAAEPRPDVEEAGAVVAEPARSP